MPRSAPSVVSAHQRVVASFEAGVTARAIISPYARSRSKAIGAQQLFQPQPRCHHVRRSDMPVRQ